MSEKKENKKKSVLDLIDDASEILKDNEVFDEIIIKGKKTNIRIKKPDKKDEQRKKN
jgi:hypothetical protein